jgi:hypothetical protein
VLALISKPGPHESKHKGFQNLFQPDSSLNSLLVVDLLILDQLLSFWFDRFPLDVLEHPELSLLLRNFFSPCMNLWLWGFIEHLQVFPLMVFFVRPVPSLVAVKVHEITHNFARQKWLLPLLFQQVNLLDYLLKTLVGFGVLRVTFQFLDSFFDFISYNPCRLFQNLILRHHLPLSLSLFHREDRLQVKRASTTREEAQINELGLPSLFSLLLNDLKVPRL